jgi:hypothetical protein
MKLFDKTKHSLNILIVLKKLILYILINLSMINTKSIYYTSCSPLYQ